MKFLFLCFVFGIYFLSHGSEEIKWHSGVLIMKDGEVRLGELAFQVSEIVLFRTKGEVSVFPANKIHSFRYYDPQENINRKFISLSSSSGRTFYFYEIVVWGKVSVIRKPNHLIITNRKKSDTYDYDYFVSYQNNLIELRKFRSAVYPNLVSRLPSFEQCVRRDHLDPNRKADAILIVDLFNKMNHTSGASLAGR